jgi:hypothetical protein
MVRRVRRPHPQQRRRAHRTRVEDEARDLDTLHVGDRHRHDPVLRAERRHAEPEDDRVRTLHPDRRVDSVDARREEQVLALRKRGVDRLHAVRGRRDDRGVLDGRGRSRVRASSARRSQRSLNLYMLQPINIGRPATQPVAPLKSCGGRRRRMSSARTSFP